MTSLIHIYVSVRLKDYPLFQNTKNHETISALREVLQKRVGYRFSSLKQSRRITCLFKDKGNLKQLESHARVEYEVQFKAGKSRKWKIRSDYVAIIRRQIFLIKIVANDTHLRWDLPIIYLYLYS